MLFVPSIEGPDRAAACRPDRAAPHSFARVCVAEVAGRSPPP